MPLTGPKMKQPRTLSFIAEDAAQLPLLLADLNKNYDVLAQPAQSRKNRLFDTFDWRLYRNKLTCLISASQLLLRDFTGTEIARCSAPRKSNVFWSDIEDRAVSQLLQEYLDMRALLAVLSIEGTDQQFKVVNQDRKTILRLRVEHYQASSGKTSVALPMLVHGQELRGYDKPFAQLKKMLSRSFMPLDHYRSYLDRAFAVAQRKPLDYGAKFQVTLEKEATIGESFSVLAQALMAGMAINQPGVVHDIDSEFLHDYRIAIRRTRSLLSLLRKQLPRRSRYFADEFKWLGAITGPLRDIDVYLLKEDTYKSLVPESFQQGLQLFFADLARSRQQVLRALQVELNSARYANLIADWKSFVEQGDSELFSCTSNGKSTIDQIIWKRFKTFVKSGAAIVEASPDEALHTLRIRGKKFRYLLEFFRSYYQPEDIDTFLKQMKKLQDNLGDFNDLSVQIAMLEATLQDLPGSNQKTIRLAAALGSLITRLQTKHQNERLRFSKTFEKFNTEPNRQLIRAMTARNQ